MLASFFLPLTFDIISEAEHCEDSNLDVWLVNKQKVPIERSEAY